MTTATTTTLRQEEDRVSTRAAALLVGATLLVILLLSLWAWWMLRGRLAAEPRPLPRAAAEVGGVRQTLIGDDTTAAALFDRQRRQLQEYGWADPEHRYARIPIGRAMEIVAREEGR